MEYNHYQNPNKQYQNIEVNEEYFYDLIEKRLNLNVDEIGSQITKLSAIAKKLQKQVVTELSLICDEDNLKNEVQLLHLIEKFKWGFDTTDFVNVKRPGQIPVYDLSVLNRGLNVPPHINVVSYILSLSTKAEAPKKFLELVTRLLRQLEIKTPGKTQSGDEIGAKILSDIFNNFHSFCNQLKNRYGNRSSIEISDEYDVQDLLHSILKLHFKDIREEEYTPSYAGSSSRVDFLLKNESIVIEVKKTRQGLADKHIGEQLILDIAHYRNHPDCKTLICFVYDPANKIKNPRGLENDLKKLTDTEMNIDVFIRP